jgi:hypothetical protein
MWLPATTAKHKLKQTGLKQANSVSVTELGSTSFTAQHNTCVHITSHLILNKQTNKQRHKPKDKDKLPNKQ